ncbi:MAG: hypothetical protein E7173_01775 [Firmicutes bacterium]|nr:hypothetical protein [Bacillota bacterium]
MSDEEVIEILDEVEDNTIKISPIKNVSIGLRNEPETSNNAVLTDTTTTGLDISAPDNIDNNQTERVMMHNLDNVEYAPIKPEKVESKVEVEEPDEEAKSGLGFIIVLFILLATFIIVLPYISKLF